MTGVLVNARKDKAKRVDQRIRMKEDWPVDQHIVKAQRFLQRRHGLGQAESARDTFVEHLKIKLYELDQPEETVLGLFLNHKCKNRETSK